MASKKPTAKVYRLVWFPYLRALGYLMLGELLLLWLFSTFGGKFPPFRFLVALWWLWPALTIALGLAGRAGTALVLTDAGLMLRTFGVPWRLLRLDGAAEARLLKVGRTLAVIVKKGGGEFQGWRQGALATPAKLRDDLYQFLGERHSPRLAPIYHARRGVVWTVDRENIGMTSASVSAKFTQADLQGVRFQFVEGDDLPWRLYLMTPDGVHAISQNTAWFHFLAADILRFAKANAVKVVCADLGQNKPRALPGRMEAPGPAAPRAPRAWALEGWQ